MSPSTAIGDLNGSDRRTLRLQSTAVFIAYLIFTLYLTWPMATDPANIFYGGIGDPIGAAAYMRELAESLHPPFLPGVIGDFDAPDGLRISWVTSLASFPSTTFVWGLAVFFGPVAAYNIFVTLAYPLTGLAMFLLTRRITRNAVVAVVAGFMYAFYPYAIIKGHGHYEFAHGWVLVIGIWRMFELMNRPTKRNGLWAGLAVVFGMAWTPYFILLGGVAYATLAAFTVASAALRREFRKHAPGQALAALTVAIYVGVFWVLSRFATSGQGLRANNVEQLNTYSARAYEYVVPHGLNTFIGDVTGPWLAQHIHGSNGAESTLYVGLSVLLLATCGLIAAARGGFGTTNRRIAISLALVGLVAGIFSAPPQGTILGVTVPFPAHFMMELTSTWRVLARFVIVVMMILSVLAAFGLLTLIRGRRRFVQWSLVIVVGVVVALDLAPRGGGSNPIGSTPIYGALNGLPPGSLAEYPLVPAAESLFEELFNQQFHGRPILNGYPSGSPDEARALSLADPSKSTTGPGLAALGVKYVVVRNVPGRKLPRRFSGDFRLIASDPSGRLFEVRPRRGGPSGLAAAGNGFGPAETDDNGSFSWLESDSGEITLNATCGSCRAWVSMRVSSLARPRELTVRDATGRILARQTVGQSTLVRVSVVMNRATHLVLTTTPGPRAVSLAIPGSTDPRSLSINVRDLRTDFRRSATRTQQREERR